MRTRRPSPEHQEAVSRRLALLSEQLASAREEAPAVGDEWWGDHTRVAPLRPALHVVPAVGEEPGAWSAPPSEAWSAPPSGPAADTLPGRPAERAAQPVVVPVPGRHADRRRITWSAVLPETLRGRVGLGPGPVAVVAVLVAVALAWTCWQVVRDDPDAPAPVAAAQAAGDLVPVGGVPSAPTAQTPEQGVAPTAGGAAGAGTVTVDVAGRVRRPGIVVLEAGSRVVDALEEAGGARGSVDLTTLNLARLLVDGEQILVGVEGGAAPPPAIAGGSPGSPGSPAAPGALVDLNLADATQLESLPEIGPVTAAAIVRWREEHGGFSAVTELLEVDGIGDATLATLTPLVTV